MIISLFIDALGGLPLPQLYSIFFDGAVVAIRINRNLLPLTTDDHPFIYKGQPGDAMPCTVTHVEVDSSVKVIGLGLGLGVARS